VGSTFALLLAAGSGTRMGRGAKALMDLGGIPMFAHAYRAMAMCDRIDGVVIVVPDQDVEAARRWIEAESGSRSTVVTAGGQTRQKSVRKGMEALPDAADIVVCHDAARPFASPSLFGRVIGRLTDGSPSVDGVVPVVPAPDTVKRVRDGMVAETIPREDLSMAQTPQAFQRAALMDGHDQAERSGLAATDDAMLLEAAGYRVAAVQGEPSNFKITTTEDLRRAEQLLARQGTT
jgi:2-C-methyl-D-erythritol 4-phosphate cytidylyltransferase